MKVLFYCQHVWGVGHYFRSMEICRRLHRHEVVMAVGGPAFDAPLPDHVRLVRLPPIKMGRDYATLESEDSGRSMAQVKADRSARLRQLYVDERPDILLIELYPFGRRKFKFELVPLLQDIRKGELSPAKVICSLRDILVAKKDAAGYETDVVQKLNGYFDVLLVHADRQMVRLDETFGMAADIEIPVIHTGFVAQRPPERDAMQTRSQLKLEPAQRLVVASAGGGRSGAPLLSGVLGALQSMQPLDRLQVHVFTGPFIEDRDYRRLEALRSPGVRLSRFSDDFLRLLSVADLSISMGGYNTSMNLIATGVPALVWPFPGDREQGLRARRLADLGLLKVLTESDLEPRRMVAAIDEALNRRWAASAAIALDGARETARYIESGMGLS